VACVGDRENAIRVWGQPQIETSIFLVANQTKTTFTPVKRHTSQAIPANYTPHLRLIVYHLWLVRVQEGQVSAQGRSAQERVVVGDDVPIWNDYTRTCAQAGI
jgi:hypothetical protein